MVIIPSSMHHWPAKNNLPSLGITCDDHWSRNHSSCNTPCYVKENIIQSSLISSSHRPRITTTFIITIKSQAVYNLNTITRSTTYQRLLFQGNCDWELEQKLWLTTSTRALVYFTAPSSSSFLIIRCLCYHHHVINLTSTFLLWRVRLSLRRRSCR